MLEETIRREIATAAMQGLIAGGYNIYDYDDIAEDAVKIADALIKELNKTK